jgi:sugar (pentulose or hexulose) kinase
MPLVAGVDSSTQSCKVVILDLETGALVRHGRARHPIAPRCTLTSGGRPSAKRSRRRAESMTCPALRWLPNNTA